MEQDCSWAGMLQIFQFCQIKDFMRKDWGFEFFEFFWWFLCFVFVCLFVFWNCQMNLFFVLTLVEQFAALQLNCWVFSRSPCSTGQNLWSLLCPHDFVPSPDPISISWSLLQLHFLKVPAGEGADAPAWTKTGHHSWRAAGPALPWGRKPWQRATSQNAQQDFLFFCQKYCMCLCRSELGWRKTLDFVWNQVGGLKHIHWRTTTKRTKPTGGANLTLSTSSSRYMSLEKQPISNSWFEKGMVLFLITVNTDEDLVLTISFLTQWETNSSGKLHLKNTLNYN